MKSRDSKARGPGTIRRASAARSSLIAVALSVSVVAPGLQAATPPRVVRLVYSLGPGAERCPGQEVIEQQVRSRLGYEPFAADATRAVTASIARARKGSRALRARVELREKADKVDGVRAELAAAVAFAISIAIDPLSGTRPPASASAAPVSSATVPPPAPSASTSVTPASSASALLPPPAPPTSASAPAGEASSRPAAPPAPTAVPPAPESRPGVLLQAGVGGFVASGTEPALGGGLLLSLGARLGAGSIGVEGRFQAPASIEVDPGKRVSASLLSALLVPCAHAGPLMVCAIGAIGSLRGSSQGVDEAKKGSSLVAAAGGRVGVEAALPAPLSVRFFGEVLANLSSVTLELNHRPAWSSPSLAAAGGFALVASFW
jgi:hypothetical protein